MTERQRCFKTLEVTWCWHEFDSARAPLHSILISILHCTPSVTKHYNVLLMKAGGKDADHVTQRPHHSSEKEHWAW